MGFFSEIASEARRNSRTGTSPQPAAPVPQEQHASSREPLSQPIPAPPKPDPASVKPTERPETPPQATPSVPAQSEAPLPAPTPEQPPELKLDAAEDAAQPQDDTVRRKAHEAAEARRKAEWDAKQAEKKATRQAALDRIAAMNGAELLAAATDRVATDTERLTRRNMKEAVAGHVQAKCRENAAFAMLVMDPAKSMVHCFQYINRQAQAYAEQEMKDNGVQRTGVYGLDVPDGLCYQWAEDYFNDPDAEEDHKDDEKFVPKPYVPSAHKKTKAKADKKPAHTEKPKTEKPADAGMEQISLM